MRAFYPTTQPFQPYDGQKCDIYLLSSSRTLVIRMRNRCTIIYRTHISRIIERVSESGRRPRHSTSRCSGRLLSLHRDAFEHAGFGLHALVTSLIIAGLIEEVRGGGLALVSPRQIRPFQPSQAQD
ncbi:hypothetical protein FA95DRAFT_853791 [Auriscalpium vulgare]|uniref:Uncharacterized protein n=1 Tax=Auriscalpium vulgare TaxID=40419 RepID=A0ACB8RAI2_9AGAM|nr:hypothetical protein FA95DRAFT_853791 [Auriscalpium vulgare]